MQTLFGLLMSLLAALVAAVASLFPGPAVNTATVDAPPGFIAIHAMMEPHEVPLAGHPACIEGVLVGRIQAGIDWPPGMGSPPMVLEDRTSGGSAAPARSTPPGQG